jgi:hypothetical protein
MKITKQELKKLIKEEMSAVLEESGWYHKRLTQRQVNNARRWTDLQGPLMVVIDTLDELWRNTTAARPSTKTKKTGAADDEIDETQSGLELQDITTAGNGVPRKR